MNSRVTTGVILGFLGAALDFSSGYIFLSQSNMTTNDMGVMISHYNASALGWAIPLVLLGILLVLTSLLSLSSFGIGRMRSFGTLMVVYGVVMLAIGSFMYSGMTPMMTGATISSVGMFAVGALMVANGTVMSRSALSGMRMPGQR